MTGRSIRTVSDNPSLAPVVAAWIVAAFFDHPDGYTIEEMTALILAPAAGPKETFVLFDDNQPVGTAALVPADLDSRPDLTPWMAGVFVEPAFRGRGHATALIRRVEALGATIGGKATGTFGLMGSFSTFFSHHMATMEGGVIATDDEEMYHILLSLRAHGWTRNLPQHNHVSGTKSADPFEESFKFVLPGYNVRPIEMEAAIGLEQLKKLPGFIAMRRANGRQVQAALGNHPAVMIQQETGHSSWFGFSLVPRVDSGVTRAMLIAGLAAEGFEYRPIVAGNFAKNPVVRYFDHEIHGDLRGAEHIDRQGLFIGNHHFDLTEAVATLSGLLARL